MKEENEKKSNVHIHNSSSEYDSIKWLVYLTLGLVFLTSGNPDVLDAIIHVIMCQGWVLFYFGKYYVGIF